MTTYDVGCGDELTQSVHHVDAADGGFRFDHLEPREYTCTARAPMGATVGKVTVGSGTATLELGITPGGTITGTAVDVLTGAPLAGLAVSVTRSRAFPEAPVVTDATGRFTIERVPASGSLTFAVAGRYSFTAAVRFTAPEGQRVDLGVIRLPAPRTGEAGELGFSVDYRGQPGVVTRMDPGGPAAIAGLRIGDQIISHAGVSLAGLDAGLVLRLLWNATAGQTIQLGLARGVMIAVTAVEQ